MENMQSSSFQKERLRRLHERFLDGAEKWPYLRFVAATAHDPIGSGWPRVPPNEGDTFGLDGSNWREVINRRKGGPHAILSSHCWFVINGQLWQGVFFYESADTAASATALHQSRLHLATHEFEEVAREAANHFEMQVSPDPLVDFPLTSDSATRWLETVAGMAFVEIDPNDAFLVRRIPGNVFLASARAVEAMTTLDEEVEETNWKEPFDIDDFQNYLRQTRVGNLDYSDKIDGLDEWPEIRDFCRRLFEVQKVTDQTIAVLREWLRDQRAMRPVSVHNESLSGLAKLLRACGIRKTRPALEDDPADENEPTDSRFNEAAIHVVGELNVYLEIGDWVSNSGAATYDLIEKDDPLHSSVQRLEECFPEKRLPLEGHQLWNELLHYARLEGPEDSDQAWEANRNTGNAGMQFRDWIMRLLPEATVEWRGDQTVRLDSGKVEKQSGSDVRIEFGPGGFSFNGEFYALQGKPLAVLKEFVSAKGGVRTKQDLYKAVWRDVPVTDDAIRSAVSATRQALREAAHLDKGSDPLPHVDRGENLAWKLDIS